MYAGPIITYHSVTDTVDPDEPPTEAEINVDGDPADKYVNVKQHNESSCENANNLVRSLNLQVIA